MKKMIKNILFFVCSALLLASCFDDDGNYTYVVDNNKISFKYASSTSTAYIGDPIVFEPIITNDSLIDTTLYRWEYHFHPYGLVCTTRVMSHVFEDIKVATSLTGIVRAINTQNGFSYTYNISASYKNIWDIGWLVLADNNGASELSLVKAKDTIWVTDQNLTQLINQQALGSNPKKLISSDAQRAEVRVIQGSGNVILQNVDYHQLGTFEAEFNSGAYPAGFVPKFFTASGGNVAAIQGEDGRTYVKIFNSATVYLSEKWFDQPMSYEGTTLDIQYLLNISEKTSAIKSLMAYDKASSKFFLVAGNGFNATTGAFLPIGSQISDETIPLPSNLSAYDNEFCILRNSAANNLEVFSVLKEKATGDYYYYNFKLAASNYNSLYATNITLEPVPAEVAAAMKEGTRYMMPPTTTTATKSHLFIINPDEPNTLYVTNTAMKANSKLEVYKTFSSPITAMKAHCTQTLDKLTMGIGLQNGVFNICNINLNVLDDLESATDEDKIAWEAQIPGRIVDLCYKYK